MICARVLNSFSLLTKELYGVLKVKKFNRTHSMSNLLHQLVNRNLIFLAGTLLIKSH